MSISIIKLHMFYLFGLFCGTSTAHIINQYQTIFNYGLLNYTGGSNRTASSPIQCTAMCNRDPECMSVSYNPGSQTCLLTQVQPMDNEYMSSEKSFALVSNDDWVTISRRYRVFVAYGPDGQKMDSAGAAARCNELGTSMASITDALPVRNQDNNIYQSSRCYWFVEFAAKFSVDGNYNICESSYKYAVVCLSN